MTAYAESDPSACWIQALIAGEGYAVRWSLRKTKSIVTGSASGSATGRLEEVEKVLRYRREIGDGLMFDHRESESLGNLICVWVRAQGARRKGEGGPKSYQVGHGLLFRVGGQSDRSSLRQVKAGAAREGATLP